MTEVRKSMYDRHDKVRLVRMMKAGALKIAAYTVLDPETGEYSELQFHMTYDNHVMALMSQSAARLFANFVNDFEKDNPEQAEAAQ